MSFRREAEKLHAEAKRVHIRDREVIAIHYMPSWWQLKKKEKRMLQEARYMMKRLGWLRGRWWFSHTWRIPPELVDLLEAVGARFVIIKPWTDDPNLKQPIGLSAHMFKGMTPDEWRRAQKKPQLTTPGRRRLKRKARRQPRDRHGRFVKETKRPWWKRLFPTRRKP